MTRSAIDDPQLRNPQLWETLATDYFNNAAYRPENDVNDERVAHLDPSKAPTTPWTGSALRQAFSTLRSKMTVLSNNFHRSGKITEGADHADGDDDFYDMAAAMEDKTFCWTKDVYLFAYLVSGRQDQRWLTRQLDVATSFDIGTSHETLQQTRKKAKTGGDVSGWKEVLAPSSTEVELLQLRIRRETAQARLDVVNEDTAKVNNDSARINNESAKERRHQLKMKNLDDAINSSETPPELLAQLKAKKVEIMEEYFRSL